MSLRSCNSLLHLCLYLSLLLGLAAATAAQPVESSSYKIEVGLDVKTHTLTGQATVTYVNDSANPISAIYFLLYPNYSRQRNPYLDGTLLDQIYENGFDPGGMRIETVTDAQGQALPHALLPGPAVFQTYSLEDTLLRVDLPEALGPNGKYTLTIKFSTKFPRVLLPDEGVHQGIYTWRFAWNPVAIPAAELIDGQYIVDDRQKRPYYKFILPTALYEVVLTLPAGYVVAAGGDQQELVKEDKETKIVRLTSAVPVGSIALSIGKKLKRYRLDAEVPIEVLYLPGSEAAARQLASYAVEILAHHRLHYGPYEYRKLTIVQSASAGYFGMAADGFVLLGGSLFTDKDLAASGMLDRLTDYVLAHEMAHQWWGIGIGADLNAENFISEAFAEYLAISYFEGKYGEFGPNLIRLERPGLIEKFVETQLGYLNLREHLSELPYVQSVHDRFDEAIVKPQDAVRYAQSGAVRIYNKGYLVLRALRGLLGKEKVELLLQNAQKEYAHKTFTIADLRRLTKEVAAGEIDFDFDGFFDQWLYREEPAGVDEVRAPTLDYLIEKVESAKTDEGRYRHRVYLARRGEMQPPLPVEVLVTAEEGDEARDKWNGAESTHVLTLETAKPFKEATVDPGSFVPDVERWNNHYPRRFRVITTGNNDLPLDAYLIRFNPLNRTIEGGYLLNHRWIIGQGFLAGVYNLGRGNSVDGSLYVGSDLEGEVGVNFLRYSHPPVGAVGRYWIPSDYLRLSLTRLAGGSQDFTATNFLSAALVHEESIQRSWAAGAGLRLGLNFTQLLLGGTMRLGILPNIHLELSAQLDAGFNAPRFLQFDLCALHSFQEVPQQGDEALSCADPRFKQPFLAFGRAAVNFPLQREMSYNIANVAVLDRIDQQVFLAAGRTADRWEGLAAPGAPLRAELGTEVTLSLRTIGGLFALQVAVGATLPIAGAIEPELTEYVRISVPAF